MSDPARFPEHGHVNHDSSNFWGFTSTCLRRMVEDLAFAVRRTDVRGDRVFIDAERTSTDRQATRLSLAYDLVPAIPVGANRDDPGVWTIF